MSSVFDPEAVARSEERVRTMQRLRRERRGQRAHERWAHVGTDFGAMPKHRKRPGTLRGAYIGR